MSTIVFSRWAPLGRAVNSVLMPPTCCLCGARGGLPGTLPDVDLCEVCATFLPVNRETRVDLGEGTGVFARMLVPFEYAYPVDHLIRALKFRDERVYARVLGTLLARAHQATRQEPPDVAIPMPLHPLRYRRRGFNQAHEIAKFAARRLGVVVNAHALIRDVPTREQSGLTLAERRRNVRGVFTASHFSSATRIALVDDVLTTGSTALAAARALKEAGAGEIELWAIARVMLD